MRSKLYEHIHLGATRAIRFELSPQCGEDTNELRRLLRAWIHSPFFGRISANREIPIGLVTQHLEQSDADLPPVYVSSRYVAAPYSDTQVVDLQSRIDSKQRLSFADQYILQTLKPASGLANLYRSFEKYSALEHRVVLDGGIVLEGSLSTLAHVTLISQELKVLGIDAAVHDGSLTPEHIVTDEQCLEMLLPTCHGFELRQRLVEQSTKYVSVSEHFYGLLHAMLPEVTRWVILQTSISQPENSDELSRSTVYYKRYRMNSRLRIILGRIFAQLEKSTPPWVQRFAALLLVPAFRIGRASSSSILYSMEPVSYHTWRNLQDSIEIFAEGKS